MSYNETYNNYLQHHGILGMHWGKKNGPPYPLGYSDHSSAEKSQNPKSVIDGKASGRSSSKLSTKKKAEQYFREKSSQYKTISDSDEKKYLSEYTKDKSARAQEKKWGSSYYNEMKKDGYTSKEIEKAVTEGMLENSDAYDDWLSENHKKEYDSNQKSKEYERLASQVSRSATTNAGTSFIVGAILTAPTALLNPAAPAVLGGALALAQIDNNIRDKNKALRQYKQETKNT